ncbi:hypothetical protein AKJ16_DCAP02872 [Drosera capensis]
MTIFDFRFLDLANLNCDEAEEQAETLTLLLSLSCYRACHPGSASSPDISIAMMPATKRTRMPRWRANTIPGRSSTQTVPRRWITIGGVGVYWEKRQASKGMRAGKGKGCRSGGEIWNAMIHMTHPILGAKICYRRRIWVCLSQQLLWAALEKVKLKPEEFTRNVNAVLDSR